MTIAIHVDQQRAEGLLGASQAAGALGLDKYNPPIKVWRQLRGLPVEDDLPEAVREAGEFGQLLEPVVRGKYALKTHSRVLIPVDSITECGWLRCTPDGFTWRTTHSHEVGAERYDGQPEIVNEMLRRRNAGEVGHLQVKTCSQRAGWQWEGGKVPARYEIQCRTELAVTKLPWCDIVCLIGGQHMTDPVRIHRDLEIEGRLLRDLRAFWELVQSGTEPPVDGSDQWRAYASEKMRPTKAPMADDADIRHAMECWRDARKREKAAKAEADTHKTHLLLRMSAAGATSITSSLGNVTAYKTGGRTDWKRYAISLGGNEVKAKGFASEGKTWALRAPSQWSDDDDED
jgi:predicted phage-related endonuclease